MFTSSNSAYNPANGIPLQTSKSAQLDSTGSCVIQMGPERAFQQWHVTRMVTTVSPALGVETLYVYRTAISQSNIIDSTQDAAQATSETDFTLFPQENIYFVYGGGTPGATATIIVTGDLIT